MNPSQKAAFHIVFLGHHGWLIEADGARVLIDPILGSGLGNMPDDVIDIHPARRFDWARFPAVDAVLISHEHPDHFCLDTLRRLDRRIPILITSRASRAATHTITRLGFPTRPLLPDHPFRIGGLEVYPGAPPRSTREEWDVVTLLLRDLEGHGSFGTPIDADAGFEFADRARRLMGNPLGAWVLSSNHIDMFSISDDARQQENARDQVLTTLAPLYQAQFEGHAPPLRPLVLPGNFAFSPPLSLLNPYSFPGPGSWLAERLREQFAGVEFRAPEPGYSLSFRGSRVEEESDEASFLRAAAPAERSPRGHARWESGALPDFGPATGRAVANDAEWAALPGALEGLAQALYGGPVFRALLAAPTDDIQGRIPLGIAIREQGRRDRLYAYDFRACAFVPVGEGDGRARFAAGFSCWITDLVAVLQIELITGYMLLGRVRCWDHTERRLAAGLLDTLAEYTHPLRHPARYEALYARTLARRPAPPESEHVPAGGTPLVELPARPL